MSIHTLEDGAVFASRYRVVRCLARGGMGAVYEVVHIGTNRRRALKVMHSHILHSEELRERFSREAQVAAEVESDYIVDVFDAGIDEATEMPFLCMELLRGEELSRRLKRLGRIPGEDLALHLHQTALALDRMHEAGIVHRDLKPENLFITEGKDGPPRIKVLDFGIAKVVADGMNSGPATLSVGTPLYMSPEQFRAKGGLTSASDVYALGMIAYTCLVGGPYWEQESRAGNIFAFGALVVQGPPEPPSARARKRGVTLPAGFDEWFATVTSVDPERRFAPATAAARALSDVLGAPVAQATRLSSPILTPPADVAVHEADALTMVPASPRPLPDLDAVTVVPVPRAAPSVDTLTAVAARDVQQEPTRLLEDDEGQTLVYKQTPDAKADILRKIELHREARRAAAEAGDARPPATAPLGTATGGMPARPVRARMRAANAPPPGTASPPGGAPAVVPPPAMAPVAPPAPPAARAPAATPIPAPPPASSSAAVPPLATAPASATAPDHAAAHGPAGAPASASSPAPAQRPGASTVPMPQGLAQTAPMPARDVQQPVPRDVQQPVPRDVQQPVPRDVQQPVPRDARQPVPRDVRPAAFNTLTPSGAVLPAPEPRPSASARPVESLVDLPQEQRDPGARWRVIAAVGVAVFIGIVVAVVAAGGAPAGPESPPIAAASPVPSVTATATAEAPPATATAEAPPSPSETASAEPSASSPPGTSSTAAAEPASKGKSFPRPKGTGRPKYTQE